MINTEKILKEKNFDFYSYIEKEIKPKKVNIKFTDIIPEFKGLEISNKNLYFHQYEAYNELRKGKNLIIKSGTGSGKTEAWLIYAIKNKIPTLAIYPTLALANDQIKRIKEYSEKTKINSLEIDSLKKSEYLKEYGSKKLIKILTEQNIIVTNPAFLMFEVKRIARKGKSLLHNFIKKLKLIVFDEVDFYSPREIALILGLINILKCFNEKNFQIVTLTAMIENPEDLAKFYSEVNKRETKIITGESFKVENRTYIVLGKDLRKIWKKIKEKKNLIEKHAGKDILETIEKFEKFKENSYKIMEIAKAINIEIDSLEFNIEEILLNYCYDDYVTLVFTKGINKAEEIARKIKLRLSNEEYKVASHHHLISKELRKNIEEGARKGKIKILISPRTLSQGIDIGTIGRIVHIGLPENLREFYQREGRKGRREDIPFSETIIIPYSKWDKRLLSKGYKTLKSWLNLPIEKIIINVDNKYRKLFESIIKFTSPFLKLNLSKEELRLLKSLNLIKGGELTEKGKEVERKLNFYEFAPPFGINRIFKNEKGESFYLEEISHCDLVEKFQPGCFDYSNEGIVTEHKIGGTTGRIVTAVIEEKINEIILSKYEDFSIAIEEYEETKYKWGESPRLINDFIYGKLHSDVLCAVYPPRRNFGKYIKVPNRIFWRLKSSKPKIKIIEDKSIIYYDHKVIEVPTATYGKYSDYTYGSFYELDPSEDTTLIRIGLAFLMLVLRKKLQIPFETIMYDVGKFGEKKFLSLHEPESAGLIKKLNWLEIKSLIKKYETESLDEILFEMLDEYSYADFLNYNLDWNLAKRYALKALDYILLEEKILTKFKGKEIYIQKPSKALRLASLEIIYIPIEEKTEKGLLVFSLFNGEEKISNVFYNEIGTIENIEEISKIISKVINEEFTILIYDYNSINNIISNLKLKSINYLIKPLREENKIIEIKEIASKILGLSIVPLEEIEKLANISRKINLMDVSIELRNSIQKIKQEYKKSWKIFTKFLSEKAIKYAEENCESIYKLYLILNEYEKLRSKK